MHQKAVYKNPTALTCISGFVGIRNISVFLRTAVLLGSVHPCEQGWRAAGGTAEEPKKYFSEVKPNSQLSAFLAY